MSYILNNAETQTRDARVGWYFRPRRAGFFTTYSPHIHLTAGDILPWKISKLFSLSHLTDKLKAPRRNMHGI